jgi:rsbT co-antagonist protein RsbR
MTGHGERVLTMTIFDLYTQDAAYLGAAAQQVIDQGFWQGILTYHHADGHTFPGDVSVFLLRDAQNQPFGFGAFARDISQQQAQTERMRSFEALAEYAPDGVSISDLNGTFFYANPAFQQMTGFGSEVIGRTIFDIYVETPEQLGAAAQQVVQTGFWKGQLTYRRPDGSTFPGAVSVFLMRNQSGEPTGFGAVARDITVELRAESERIALQTQVIEAQQAALRELSTPLIPLADGVVAMPLIGSIDSSRAQLVIETLLQGVAEQKAHTTIIDITGVPVVDTQVASALLRAAQAVKLLGAKVVLTGIRPEVAQTLVGLGLDLSGITTRGTLQSGVAEALKR